MTFRLLIMATRGEDALPVGNGYNFINCAIVDQQTVPMYLWDICKNQIKIIHQQRYKGGLFVIFGLFLQQNILFICTIWMNEKRSSVMYIKIVQLHNSYQHYASENKGRRKIFQCKNWLSFLISSGCYYSSSILSYWLTKTC